MILLLMLVCLSATSQELNTVPAGDAALCKTWKKLELDSFCNAGLQVYDITREKWLFRYQDHHFFIPASNTKILTLYAALHTLEDTLDAARYLMKGDSLFIWGAGDPGTRYPNIESGSLLVDLIRYTDKKIIFSNHHFQTSRYGSGWAWDDHVYNYQCERNSIPLYGNRIWIERIGDTISITPRYFAPLVEIHKDSISAISRSEWGDAYRYDYLSSRRREVKTIPITFFKNDLRLTWTEATGKDITFLPFPLAPNAQILKGSLRDTMLYNMMQESDNFIAEQLLLAASLKKLGIMNEKPMIDYLLKGPMNFIHDTVQWTDGSGLSRYSLMSPATFVEVLTRLYQEKGMDFIKAIFLPGGLSNTKTNWYLDKSGKPFVYAKSGSMRNVLNLSGYVITKKGRVLIFSWMNNQCMTSRQDLNESIQKMLLQLYEDY